MTNDTKPDSTEDCSHACVLYQVDGKHIPECWPIEPRTEAERETTREEYRAERIRAGIRESTNDYNKRKDGR